ncbi:MAG: ABC transporter substrate-binding protein, partial [Chloroflexota bacterium]
FLEKDKRWGYAVSMDLSGDIYINTDVVKQEEVRTVQDLLAPKWKGQLHFTDIRSGYTSVLATGIRLKYGESILRRLFVEQEPVYSRDNRLVTENMVRGKYPIATGVVPGILQEFLDRGLGKNLKSVFLTDPTIGNLATPILRMRNPPHPNAAKLFINWFLTKQGQTALSQSTGINSRRLDVSPASPSRYPEPGKPLGWIYGNEEAVEEAFKTQKLVIDWLGG